MVIFLQEWFFHLEWVEAPKEEKSGFLRGGSKGFVYVDIFSPNKTGPAISFLSYFSPTGHGFLFGCESGSKP